MDIVNLSRELMLKRIEINKAPAWLLTKIAIEKGRELSQKYHVDERLILTSLYLAHTVFSPIWKGEIQKNHPQLSAEFVKSYLGKWNVNNKDQETILNAILAHHNHVQAKSKVAEIVKNAEGFKFLTVRGSLIFLHELGKRGVPYNKAKEMVIEKMYQKRGLLTLSDCIGEADINIVKILNIFNGNI